jgi:hypothetical protein
MTSSTNAEPIQQHIVPRHLLARFVNDDGRLTVVRQKPAMIVLRRQAPENVGTQRRFNSYQDEHEAESSYRSRSDQPARPMDRT